MLSDILLWLCRRARMTDFDMVGSVWPGCKAPVGRLVAIEKNIGVAANHSKNECRTAPKLAGRMSFCFSFRFGRSIDPPELLHITHFNVRLRWTHPSTSAQLWFSSVGHR